MSKAIAAILSWLALVVCPLPASAAPTITAGSATVGVGDTFTIQVSITGAEGLSTWQFDLGFDPLILQANSVSQGGQPLLSEGFLLNGLIDDLAGSNPSDMDVLAEIEFTALAAGTSALALSDVLFDGSLMKTTIFDGTVTVNGQVPEPGTLALVVLASGVLALRRRQYRMGGPEAARRLIG
ncbi:MAG: PEP-CTERM sorting domain-containing protein [Burkholderiales bacterium]|nr:PEP-CTERM sorting domain-containing protein [Burkholderiales bacterium]